MAISVGFVGLGNMGNPMALNVLKKGFPLTVFDLNPKAIQNVVEAGAKGAASAAEVIRNCEVLMSCLPGSPESEAFYLGAGGAIELAKAGMALVDLSSVLPSTPRMLEARAKARGLQFLEAPVSGGVTGARAATLAVMTGGDAAVLERVRPILNAIGQNIYHVGPVGSGNTIKAINNMMSTVNACTMMEGFIVGLKSGLDLKTMAEIVKASSGNSNALARVDRALIPRNFEPGFKVALMNKDLDTFHAIAKEVHVPVTFSNLAQHYQQAALAAGYAEKDTSVIFTLIERLAGIERAKQ
ncbi:MAG TPA: NAD(P)-dependent oxidoreductase [Burkholderiales bacterium]|nr:NAD(P)-dependent oxidoreductase [Burkholderiales bacterium]